MTDYSKLKIETLTIDDALNDLQWNHKPSDFAEYVAIDFALLRTITSDFCADDIQEAMVKIGEYCLDGCLPDYGSMKSTAAKTAVRMCIAAHDKRINSEYLKKYKQYVGGKQKGKVT